MKNWKAIVGVCLVFALGMVSGGLVTVRVITKRIQRIAQGGPQAVNQIIVRRLTKRLDLDSSQSGKLMDIIVDTRKDIRSAREQISPQLKQIMDDSESKVRALLNPEQQKKFDEVLAENKQRIERFEGTTP